MKKILRVLSLPLSLITAPAMAQTATGVGLAKSASTATAGAVAISGQGGGGGSSNSSLTVNSSVPAVQTVNSVASGTQTLKNVPTVFAPGLAAAGLETCLGSVSAGAGVVGTGASFGTTIPDPSCAARLDARTLWSFGLKKAAVARLCLQPDIYRSMPEICYMYQPPAAPAQVGFTLFPTSAPVPVAYEAAGTSYRGGPIMLVEGRTGQNRLCSDYDEPGQKCKVWAYSGTRKHASAKKKAVAQPLPQQTPAAKPAEGEEGKKS
jgi:hypothetical protein